MTGDDHNQGGTAGRFDQYKEASPPGCSVVLWECVRSTSYIYADYQMPGLTASEANAFVAEGFELALHPTFGDCPDPTDLQFNAAYEQRQDFAAQYPDVPAPTTSRFHCVPWPDWSTHAWIEVAHGIRLDTNYYQFPPAWGFFPGYMTGSAEIMRFADLDGSTIPLYQSHTHLNDEAMNPAQVGAAINVMLDAAIGPKGYYGLLTANMHTDAVTSAGSDAIVASAQARSVPIISARQALDWTEGRDGSSFVDVTWSAGRLGFTVAAGPGTTGLQGMVPVQGPHGPLVGVSRHGADVPVTTRTIKGVEYAFFAAVSGRYEAVYPHPPVPAVPDVPAVPAVPGGTPGARDRKAPHIRLSAPHRRSLRQLLRRGIAFRVRCSEACRLKTRLIARMGGRNVVVGRSSRSLRANRSRRVVVKIGPRAARRLGRAHPPRIKLRVSATDTARNTRTAVRSIRLRR
jgi:hypothetical protein